MSDDVLVIHEYEWSIAAVPQSRLFVGLTWRAVDHRGYGLDVICYSDQIQQVVQSVHSGRRYLMHPYVN